MSEDNEVLSLIDLEEELAREKFQNQNLQSELAEKGLVRNKTVDLLEIRTRNCTQEPRRI